MAYSNRGVSPGARSSPVSPCVTNDGTAPTAVLMTGRPMAIASSTTHLCIQTCIHI